MGPDGAGQVRRQLQDMLDTTGLELDRGTTNIFDGSGAEELDQAVDHGVLTVVTTVAPLDTEKYLET